MTYFPSLCALIKYVALACKRNMSAEIQRKQGLFMRGYFTLAEVFKGAPDVDCNCSSQTIINSLYNIVKAKR